jgi:hypothetical protein
MPIFCKKKKVYANKSKKENTSTHDVLVRQKVQKFATINSDVPTKYRIS